MILKHRKRVKKVKKEQPDQPQQPHDFSQQLTNVSDHVQQPKYNNLLRFQQMFNRNDEQDQHQQQQFHQLIQNQNQNQILSQKNLHSLDFKLQNNVNQFQQHFGIQQSELLKTVKEVKKAEAKKRQQVDLSLDLEIDVNQQIMEKQNQILNNRIEEKEFQIDNGFKKLASYKTKYINSLQVDRLFGQNNRLWKELTVFPKLKYLLENDNFDDKSKELLSMVGSMNDLIYIDPENEQADEIRKIWMFHILNYLLTHTKDQNMDSKELKKQEKSNQYKLQQNEQNGPNQEQKEGMRSLLNNLDNSQNQKQNKGFTQPRVLVLLPYKKDAFQIISNMSEMYSKGNLKKITNRQKFIEEYGDIDKELDDDFKLGISIVNKSIKLYSQFMKSDMIVASPLGLRLAIQKEQEQNSNFKRKQTVGFLSSIEILVIEQANTIYFQNWEHLQFILEQLNKIPDHSEMANDIYEVRNYYFENLGKFFRQNIVYSEHQFIELNTLRINSFNNYQGLIQIKPQYQSNIQNYEPSIELYKFEVDSIQEDFEVRFKVFRNKVWDKIANNQQDQKKTIIFVNSYYEYIKLRNFFKKSESIVKCISEYTAKPKIQKIMAYFNRGQLPLVMITERAYYFNINLYIFREMVQSIEISGNKNRMVNNKVTGLFNQLDYLSLEKIVGSQKASEYNQKYYQSAHFVL